MVNLTINKKKVSVPEGTTIMNAAKNSGIEIPHLCYLKEMNEIAACRVCVVEIEGNEKLVTACNNVVEEGMVVYTNSPRVRETRKTIVRLILSQHRCECATCLRSGNCGLQKVANDLGCIINPYRKNYEETPWDADYPIVRDNSKCIKCMRCIQICDKVQSLHVWDVVNTGSRTTVNVADNRDIKESGCVSCGQCITHCPVSALNERDDIGKVLDAINNPDVVTVVQVAPAVRTAWAEDLQLAPEKATEKRLAAILKSIGFDYVFDTNFSADLTIMEEGTEFISKLNDAEAKFPMFTSCCPGWVSFVKKQYPEFVGQLSTAKSPQQMFGAVAKSYFAQKMDIDPSRICCVSIMPCTAKKGETDLPGIDSAGAGKDVDYVLTTRELGRLVRGEAIVPELVDEEEFDSPLGTYSGAGVIFGSTGGVMEAALRSAYYLVTGSNPDPDAFATVRGANPWLEKEFEINGIMIKIAVVSGLGNTRKLLDALKRGEVSYHFVEVMACPGGCVGGGGQPIRDGEELGPVRAPKLYELDKNCAVRFSHENEEILRLYDDYLEKPNSHRAHELLHVDHFAK